MYDNIKVVFFDVDGTLTDGIYQISNKGTITKSFHTRDFYGIEQLMREGISVVIITQSHDAVINEQLDRICDHSDFWDESYNWNGKLKLWCAIDNKKYAIEEYLHENGLTWEDAAYMGDAENDMECIQLAAFSGCPTDAVPKVRDIAIYPSDYFGGRGAVHDFCMYIIEKRKQGDQ